MSASAYVGRVGGLAVALGIGVVTVNGTTTAWGAPAESSSSDSTSAGAASSTMQAARPSGRSRGGRSVTNSSESLSGSQARGPVAVRTPMTAAGSTRGDDSNLAMKQPTTPPHLQVVALDVSAQPAASAPTGVSLDSVVVQSVIPPASATPVATAVVPPTPSRVAASAGGLDSAPNPLLGNNPLAPASSAVSWVMLAAARRDRRTHLLSGVRLAR